MRHNRLPRARIINNRLMSEPSLDPPEDPPEMYDEDEDPDAILEPAERHPVEIEDEMDLFDWGYPDEPDVDCEYWSKTV